ncbi:MAG: hypothetical protein ACJ8C4_13440 [Gemmataceae bacterium]
MPLTVAVVELAYDCQVCDGPISATLHMSGGLEGPEGPYCVCQALKCPHCERINDVIFDSAGHVRVVTARVKPVLADPVWN